MLVVASLAFATSAPLARAAAPLSPLIIAAGRCLIASLALACVRPRELWASLRRLKTRASPERRAVLLAGALLALHFALFLSGLAATSLPAAVALVSLEPLGVVLAAWVAFGLRPTRGEGTGVVVATLGALVVASGAGTGEQRLFGDALVVGAVVVYGAYVAAARHLRGALPMIASAALVFGVAGLLLVPAAALVGRFSAAPLVVPPLASSAWVFVVLLGVVPTLIGHTLVQVAARRVPPAVVALVSPGETVGSLAIGAVLLQASPTPREAAGVVVVLLGATVAILGGRSSSRIAELSDVGEAGG